MPSLINGYNYDIFISYRQKDNKYDGWVTEFVNHLKGELEATFKEDISVYFDINPHDGLLVTHDVDESLKEKLKCLIFIPVISRTYCDPMSFAWEHEFKVFVELASNDQFGLKVKLPGGNVASRVLPVRIYDLNNTDIKLCEVVLGGVLRGVEFIYAEPGVNRPLKPDDDDKTNLNKTRYRNQINKVGNAIEEIISGLKTEPEETSKATIKQKEPSGEIIKEEKTNVQKEPVKSVKRRWLSIAVVVLLLIIAAILVYPKIFKHDTLEKLRSSGNRISVAVMPFQNMTNDTTWNVWQDGIQEILINTLSTSEELSVRQTKTIKSLIQSKGLTNYASITPSLASKISQKLDADIYVFGKIIQAGQTLRVYAQLAESKSEEVFKSFQIEGIPENILSILDSLSSMVKDFLILSKLRSEMSPMSLLHASTTNSPEAYMCYINGRNAYFEKNDPSAMEWYLKALGIDSNFTGAALTLPYAYSNQGQYEEAKKWCLKLYAKRDQMPLREKLYANLNYAYYFETPNEEIEYDKQRKNLDDQSPDIYFSLAYDYIRLFQYNRAIPEYEKALQIYNKWNVKPPFVYNYTALGFAYHKTGQYKKEKKLYRKAQRDFPDDIELLGNQIILSLSEGDNVKANRYIEKFISWCKDNTASEAYIETRLAQMYSGAGILDKAEEFYRKALSQEPENPHRMNNLAWFLIDNDQDIDEGLILIEKALELNPGNSAMLDTEGWGLYKQGKFKEALGLLEKAWTLKPVYDHEIYLHLEAAKKAVAGL